MSTHQNLVAYIADFNKMARAFGREQITLFLDQTAIDRLAESMNIVMQTADPAPQVLAGEPDWEQIELTIAAGRELQEYVLAAQYTMPTLLVP